MEEATSNIFFRLLKEKDCNVMIDGKNLFNQQVKYNLITYKNIWNIATGQRDDYTNGNLLDYNFLKYYYSMIAIKLNKQQLLEAYPKATQQINFTENLNCRWHNKCF